jgi:hypothetical protein
MTKVCEHCGREFEPREPWHRYCSPKCHQAATGRQSVSSRQAAQPPSEPDTRTAFQFGPDYLVNSYFEAKGDKRYLRPEVLDSLAMDVARLLGNQGMKPAQLRRFFNKARGIESKLDRVGDFEAIKADIYGFKRAFEKVSCSTSRASWPTSCISSEGNNRLVRF